MIPDFAKMDGLIPAVIQDSRTGNVLMLGFMNEEAFEKTKADRKVTFYSRTKKRLWTKGETSGNFLSVDSLTLDCDNDTLLVKATPAGPICHTGSDTCFNETNDEATHFLARLEEIICDRKANPDNSSYTTSLFSEGLAKIAQKVGEEATEVVVAALAQEEDDLLNESADLLYHLIVLLRAKGLSLHQVQAVLASRHR
jgi:phosphoribosyl-ATP pyrophosphohydrolase/phosphoribosyl-AMP cyclohydrolase